jgi:hypothetical protein
MAGPVTGSGSLRTAGIKWLKADATAEEKVAYLLQRDQESQIAMNALAGRVTDRETQTPRQLEEQRGQLARRRRARRRSPPRSVQSHPGSFCTRRAAGLPGRRRE